MRIRKFMINIAVLSMIMLVFVVMFRMSPVSAQEIPRDQMLVVSKTSRISTIGNFNPLVPTYSQDRYYSLGFFEPLYVYDTLHAALLPWIADGLPTFVNNYTLQVKLKTGVKWQDGVNFTAQDVEYTFELGKRGILAGPYASIDTLWANQNLVDVEAVDNYTVRFHMNMTITSPQWVLLRAALASDGEAGYLPMHIFQSLEQRNVSLATYKFDPPVGTGPYKLLSYTQERVIAIRDETWWGQKYFGRLPAPKYFVFIQGSSNDDVLRKMIATEVDWQGSSFPQHDQLRQLYNIITWSTNPPYFQPAPYVYDGYGFNLPRMDQRFGHQNAVTIRNALGYAINRQAIIAAAYFNTGTALNDVSMIPPTDPSSFLRDEPLLANNTWTYDPTKAKQILDDAGIKDYDGDGTRELSDQTTEVTLSMYTIESFADWVAAAEFFVTYARSVGIKVDSTPVSGSIFVNVLKTGTDDDVYAFQRMQGGPTGYYALLAPYDNRAISWPNAIFGGGPGSAMHYVNQEIQSLRDQIAGAYDPFDPMKQDQLKQIASRIQNILMGDIPIIPVASQPLTVFFTTKYWTGWPTTDNPYSTAHTALTMERLLTLLNVKSISGSSGTPIPPGNFTLPANVEATINQTYLSVAALQTAISALQNAISNMTQSISNLQASQIDYTLTYVNVALTMILIVVVVYLAMVVRRQKPSD